MRNEETRFAQNPVSVDMPRSIYNFNNKLITTMNVGDIVPIYCSEVYPGDTFDLDTNMVARMQTLLAPIMDDIYLDTYFFYVPNRLVWEHWKEFQGESHTAWIPQTNYSVPKLKTPASTGFDVGSIADYFGLPIGVADKEVNALPFRAYAKIMNDWFRDENILDELSFPVNDSTVVGVTKAASSNPLSDVAKGGAPYKAAKLHDYFTSCLPSPQKGPDVMLPLGTTAGVYTGDTNYPFDNFPKNSSGYAYSMRLGKGTDGTQLTGDNYIGVHNGEIATTSSGTFSPGVGTIPLNLYADLTNATAASINQIRLAFQLQKFYEKLARGGSRYVEIIKSMWGVTSPDYRLQRSEYLGGKRIPLNINQVVQTSGTVSGSTPQGHTSAFSLTTDSDKSFIKSFTEHGLLIGVAVARYKHSYQQGLDRMWSRDTRFDYYQPVFANIGEQAVLEQEIYCDGSSNDKLVFGYQEAWADLRYRRDYVTGEMRSVATNSLDIYHLADDYSQAPTLSGDWIVEDKSNVDRALAVTSAVSNQIFANFYFDVHLTRIIPMYSVPGLVDHH